MKGFKKLIVWALIPITLELVGFTYFNNFYLNNETSFNTKKVDLVSIKPTKINVNISDSAKNIAVSYNGNYISYFENGVINVVDTTNNNKKEINSDSSSTFSKYIWLPDRDIMLIAEKCVGNNGASYIKFQSYNAKKNEKTILSDQNNKQINIHLNDSRSDVQDITLSTATNVTYVQVGLKGTKSKIYRINVMAQIESIQYVNCTLGNIAATNNEDKLVYEDSTYNRIRVAGMKDVIATGENATHYLLGTDNQDSIYIGNGENNKVNKIFVVSLNKPRSQWKTIVLKQSADKNNIYITRAGKIYINDLSTNSVLNLETGKETNYKGIFVKLYDLGVISKDGGKLTGNLI